MAMNVKEPGPLGTQANPPLSMEASEMNLLTKTPMTYVIESCTISFLEAEIHIPPVLTANITPRSQKMRKQLSLLERCQGVTRYFRMPEHSWPGDLVLFQGLS